MRLGIGKGNVKYKLIFTFIIILLFFIVLSILNRLESTYNLHFSAIANNTANEITASTMSDVFENDEFKEFIDSQNTTENRITAINTDTAKINRLKSRILLSLNDKIKAYSPKSVKIPIMSASGFGVLSGIGPRIPIKISPISLINSEFEEKFTSAGINCVKYTLKLNVTMSFNGSGFMYSISEPVNTEIIIVDTIISGDIPNYYGTDVGLIGE